MREGAHLEKSEENSRHNSCLSHARRLQGNNMRSTVGLTSDREQAAAPCATRVCTYAASSLRSQCIGWHEEKKKTA